MVDSKPRVLFASLLIACGCAAEASIGSNRCPSDWGCTPPPIAPSSLGPEVSTSSARQLAPTWSKSQELGWFDAPSDRPVDDESATLARANDGRLWLFVSAENAVRALLLDGDARLVATQQVGAPSALRLAARPALRLPTSNHPRGPVVPVSWPVVCSDLPAGAGPVQGRVAVGQSETTCEVIELLVFDAAGAPAVRIPTWPRAAPKPTEAVFRSALGDMLLIPELPGRIIALDLQGRKLWQSQVPSTVAWQDAQLWLPEISEVQHAAISSDGSLTLTVQGDLQRRGGSTLPSLGLLRIDEGGALALRSIAIPYLAPRAHSVFADLQDRLLVPLETTLGDLLILRIADPQVEQVMILREGYTALRVLETAMDPAGTLYFTTLAGGREQEAQQPLLCRLGMQQAPLCFAIRVSPTSMQAPVDDVIYTLSAQGLSRFDLPPL